ncbi:5'-nucleotidase domain-containing protein 1-like [Daphnia pulex]|uniref:5'-nucleotidase domain-containing protein 1-like n=1 Tax=Daphnia pulex TaxID=6669 RepID=UPI001EDFA1A4|nr:5'-nucleotidase domain-containing protein 1-like [Daphnia pulex]
MMAAASTTGRSIFRIRHYDCVGFDMDHTLCRYRLGAVFEMEYQALADYLIREKGYDARLKRPLAEDANFLHKGIVMDVDFGNFVKLSADGRVLRASHGTRVMTDAEITGQYGPLRSDESLRQMAADPIDATEGPIHRKYRPFKDYFDLPALVMCARIVDLLDYANGNKPLEKYNFWKDVLYGLVEMFSRDNLKLNAGGYYPKIKLNPELYLRPCGDGLKKWLTEVKKKQVTFLISGSDPDYVQWVASYCLGTDWKNYFDYIVCASKKPGFFSGNRPFQRWNHSNSSAGGVEDQEIELEELLPINKTIYLRGNWNQLKSSMAWCCGVDHPKVLYFGDHLIQDVLAADTSRLDVVAMVEELAAESQPKKSPPIDGLCSYKRWGSFFYDERGLDSNGPGRLPVDRMNTLWSNLIAQHARLCISYMEAISDYPTDHEFATTQNGHTKFLGFLPSLPTCLL